MTRIEAIIGEDGIVVASDGNALDKNRNLITDDHLKIFELSPLCVVMPSGIIPTNIAETMIKMQNSIVESGDWQASSAAEFLLDQCTRGQDYVEWLRDDRLMFNIAGYNYLEGDVYKPVLLSLFRRDGIWMINTPVDNRILVGGDNFESSHVYLEELLETTTPRVEDLNRIAVDAIRQAELENPGIIGGKISLWNIFPDLEKGIVKLPAHMISQLLKDILEE